MNAFAAAIEPQTLDMSALFLQHRMRIPELQRPFAWTTLQAQELCSDLKRVRDAHRLGQAKPQHYFGSLVVVERALEPDDIVDGQQRTTTVSLLLGLIRGEFLQLKRRCQTIEDTSHIENERRQAREVALQAAHAADNLRLLLFDQRGMDRERLELLFEPKMSVSPEITQTYRSFIEGGDGLVPEECDEPARSLRLIADYFTQNLIADDGFAEMNVADQFSHLELLRDIVEHGLVVVRLATDNAGAAFVLFESLNARGVHLNAIDHLKVWMLSSFAEAKEDDHAIASQMRSLANQTPETQVNFFSDFHSARSQDTSKYDGVNNPKPLVIAARKGTFKDPALTDPSKPDAMRITDRIAFEVSYMTRLWPFWRSLRSQANPLPEPFSTAEDANWLRSRLALLFGTLKHQQGYPFLMVAAERLQDRPADFLDLVHSLEKFFFRYKTICGGRETVISGLYQKLLTNIDDIQGVDVSFARGAMRDILVDHAGDQLFKDQLVKKLGYQQSQRPRTKYFLQMLDEYSHPIMPWKQRVFDPSHAWHLEHIVPQNPRPGEIGLEPDEASSIGNLCLLPPEINNRLSNLNYEEKQTEAIRLRDLPVPDRVVIDLSDAQAIFYSGVGPTWSSVDVQTRIAALQDAACRIFTV